MTNDELFHTVTSAARKIGVTVKEVKRLISAGVIPIYYYQPSEPFAEPKPLLRQTDVARFKTLFALQGIPKAKRSRSKKVAKKAVA
jgi:hypothetical protein